MAKKIRFALEMGDGTEVRSVTELKEHFSLEKVIGYIANGKMETWLRDRYEMELADAVAELKLEEEQFEEQVCSLFGIEYSENIRIDIENLAEREHRLTVLKGYTEDEEILSHVNEVAFTQDDVYDFLDKGCDMIYLCGETFEIPLSKQGVHYIGVNKPEVIIRSSGKIDFEEKQIIFDNVQFDDEYEKILEKSRAYHLEVSKTSSISYNVKVCDENDDIVKDINSLSDMIFSVDMIRDNVYYIAYSTDESEKYHLPLKLYIYNITSNKVETFPYELESGLLFLGSFFIGLRGCSDNWVVYSCIGEMYIFDLKNKSVNKFPYDYTLYHSLASDRGSRFYPIIKDKFFAKYVGNRIDQIDLKTLKKHVLYLGNKDDVTIEGRLMTDGKDVYCLYSEKDEFKMAQISGEERVVLKTITWRKDHNSATAWPFNRPKAWIEDSVYYNGCVYLIMKLNSTDNNYILSELDLGTEKSRQLDSLILKPDETKITAYIEIKNSAVYYELFNTDKVSEKIVSKLIQI